jgi:hypothetical protein
MVFSSRRSEAFFEFTGSMIAGYDLSYCVGHPLLGTVLMISSIYLVVVGAWNFSG